MLKKLKTKKFIMPTSICGIVLGFLLTEFYKYKAAETDNRILSNAKQIAMLQDGNPRDFSTRDARKFLEEFNVQISETMIREGEISYVIDRRLFKSSIKIEYNGEFIGETTRKELLDYIERHNQYK